MNFEDDIKKSAADIVDKVETCIEESAKYIEEQAHLMVLKQQMKKEVEEMVEKEKKKIVELEKSIGKVYDQLDFIRYRISEAAEGKMADEAIESLKQIREKVRHAVESTGEAADSCKLYSWL